MQLEWSRFAQADREAIFDYIEADSPQAAIAVDDRIRQQVEELIETYSDLPSRHAQRALCYSSLQIHRYVLCRP